MTTVRDFVNVVIDRQTRSVSRQGFGTLLVATNVVPVAFTERVRIYTDAADMLDDGFLEGSDAYNAVQAAFAQSPRPVRVMVGRVDLDAPETWAAGLNAIAEENNDWYGLVATTHDVDDQLAIAAWVESFSTSKIYGTSTSDPNALVALAETDVGFQLKALNRLRTFTFYTADVTQYPEAAMFAVGLGPDPGTITWAFKDFSGITPADNLTTTQSTNAQAKNYLLYQTVGGVQITENPKTAQGEWIDIVHGVDWLTARITERIFGLLVNSPKVPFTDAGITSIVAEISAQLSIATSVGFLTEDKPYEVIAPKAIEVPNADKAARTLNGVKFTGYLAGAIHFVGVQGVVTY